MAITPPTRAARLRRLFETDDGPVEVAVLTSFAGTGKTTALRSVAAADVDTIHLRLGAADGCPTFLRDRLTAAVDDGASAPGAPIADLLRASPWLSAGVPRWLLLDDVHTVDGTPTMDLLATLVDDLPDQLHLALAGRTALDLGLDRHAVDGRLRQISATELALTPCELAQALNLPPNGHRTRGLVERWHVETGGWPAAAALLARHPDVIAGPASPGRDRPWSGFLDAEVLGDLTPTAAEVLPWIAMVSEAPVEMLAELIGKRETMAAWRELARKRLIDADPTARGVFRLHPVIVGHHRGGHDLGHEPAVATAIRWLQVEGDPASALRLALGVNDLTVVADLLTNAWPDLIDAGASELIAMAAKAATRAGASGAAVLRILDDHRGISVDDRRDPIQAGRAHSSWSQSLGPALDGGDVCGAMGARDRVGLGPDRDLPLLLHVKLAAASLWSGDLDRAQLSLFDVVERVGPRASLARIAAHTMLAVVALEQNLRPEAERQAAIGIGEATRRSLTDRPDVGLAYILRGVLDDDDDDLHLGLWLLERADAVAMAYGGSLFLGSARGRLSPWFKMVRSRVERVRRQSGDLGPIVADRWRLAGLHPRHQYGIDVLTEPLTAREMEQLRFLASDLTQRGIALRMGVSFNTVKARNRVIFRKLDAGSRHEALSRAVSLGILAVGEAGLGDASIGPAPSP